MKFQPAFLPALGLAACLLAASLGCDGAFTGARREASPLRTVYAPTETGLTLVYEQPTLPPDQRAQERLQVRVAASRETPQGQRITLTYSSLHGTRDIDFLTRKGGWFQLQGETPVPVLPERFADGVNRWWVGDTQTLYRVIGRAELRNSFLQLPDDFDRIGVWLETRTFAPGGQRWRVFYLPGIGVAESRIYLNGQWVVASQLVSRGFTDAPVTKTETKTP